ncbi:MAG: amidase [Chloroflexota bacterium]
MKKELIYLTATEALKLFRAKKLSPVELLEAHIQRIEALNGKVNCIAYTHFDEAMQQARDSEQRYLRGEARPLEGIPCAIKDDADVKGWTHHWGTLLFKDRPPAEHDHPVVDMLRNAGAVMHLQTTAPEFFLAGVTWSYLWGVTRNPWNLDYTPGGSSGGSAAALAAGFTTLALGSDMGGSIRIPASMCGLYSCKPPFGRVPTSEVAYETFGPMARAFDDMNLMQQVISGPHPRMHASLKPKLDYPESYADVRGWKVAVDPLEAYNAERDESVSGSVNEAIARLREIGCEVEIVDLGFRHEDFEIMLGGLMSTEMGMLGVAASQAVGLMTPYVQDYLLKYGDKTGPQSAYAAAELLIRYHAQAQERVFARGFRAIVMPTMLTPYVKADWFAAPGTSSAPITGEEMEARTRVSAILRGNLKFYARKRLARIFRSTPSAPASACVTVNGKQAESRMGFFATWMWNLLGRYPVVNMPTGITNENIPLGTQLIANTFADLDAVQLASAYAKVAPDFYSKTFPDFAQ